MCIRDRLNGEKRPIGEIMDIVPGLRDYVEKNGFNPAFPEDIGRIARDVYKRQILLNSHDSLKQGLSY